MCALASCLLLCLLCWVWALRNPCGAHRGLFERHQTRLLQAPRATISRLFNLFSSCSSNTALTRANLSQLPPCPFTSLCQPPVTNILCQPPEKHIPRETFQKFPRNILWAHSAHVHQPVCQQQSKHCCDSPLRGF